MLQCCPRPLTPACMELKSWHKFSCFHLFLGLRGSCADASRSNVVCTAWLREHGTFDHGSGRVTLFVIICVALCATPCVIVCVELSVTFSVTYRIVFCDTL